MLSSITFLLQPTHVENVFLSVLPPINHFVISPSCNLLYITSQFIERAGLPQWQAALQVRVLVVGDSGQSVCPYLG
jgi:hypothetical protein